MQEAETQFKSFEEATGALRFMLEHLEPGRDFSASEAFEIAEQAIKLKSGDESFDSQKESMIKDLIAQKREFAIKYEAADEVVRQELLESLQKNMENNFLGALERH